MISGAIVATDAGTTPAGMAMALVHEHAPDSTAPGVALGVGISQEGEAMSLLLCVRLLVPQEGVYWVVPDTE